MDERWHEMWRLFHAALEAPEGAAEWLRAQELDASLRAELSQLLHAHGRAGDAALWPTEADGRSRSYGPGDLIGVYRLEAVLGEGGMGRVFAATQLEPIERRVALKVIKRGLDSDEIVERFHSERQILARMVHPSIATTYDAGVTDDGRPYFVMEHLDGSPIDRYCDERRLGVAERLRLVQDVCAAVQHAHQKGIVHRDIKPSNILVVEIDGRPVPKVIDFGIAKAIGDDATLPRTRYGDILGTPDFMSPEQVGFDTGDVDSRADVYALGVLTYYLLVGCVPLERGLPQWIARRGSPPSAPALTRRLDALDRDEGTLVASSRGCALRELKRQLAGDLEWITARAMEVERERRYASCSELAADLERFLEREPVLAGPPGARYRLGKFIERHRLEVALASIATVVLAALLVGLGVQTVRLGRALAESRLEGERLRQTSEFLVDVFEVADPETGGASERTALEVLDSGAERVMEAIEDPAVYLPLVAALGRIYGHLGEYDRSAELFAELVRRQGTRETDPLDGARSHHLLGGSLIQAGEWAAAERHLRLALELRRELLGPEHLDTVDSERQLVGVWVRRGRNDAALPILERILALQRAAGAEALDIAETWRFLGAVHYGSEHFEQAVSAFRRALDLSLERLPAGDRRLFKLMNPLALSLERAGRLEAAEAIYRQALEQRRLRVDERHPDVANLRLNLGLLQLRQVRYEDAEANMRAGYFALREQLGDSHPQVLHAQLNWSSALYLSGRREQGIESLFDVEQRLIERLGPEDARRLSASAVLTHYLLQERRFEEAEAVIRPVHEIRARTPAHPAAARAASLLGEALAALGRSAEAERLLTGALTTQLQTLGADHRQTRDTWRRLQAITGDPGRLQRWRRHFPPAP